MNPDFEKLLRSVGPIGAGKSSYIITMGCQMNEHDSEVIAAIVQGMGFNEAESAEEADLIIINTCAVRKKPEDKVASLLGKYLALKEEKKELLIAVGGCMPQQPEAAAYLKKRFHHVNLIFGTHALPRLPALLQQCSSGRGTVIAIEEDYPDREGLPAVRRSDFQAWLPISYGCNNFCSYCVVPHVRGRERSRTPEQVSGEFARLKQAGYLDITLLGQNVNSYGHDLPDRSSFALLLRTLNEGAGKTRIRFMTSHPKDLSRELVQAVADSHSLCEHFHLPVQSGSNRILKLMNRRYTREHYLELISMIKTLVPGASITTDLIVGFPGETEEDFKQSLTLVKEARFDNAFSFIYSPRKNTAAAALDDSLSRSEKEARLTRLNNLQHKISKEINESLKGSHLEVLVEGRSKSDPAMQTGRTRTNKLVHFEAGEDLGGSFVTLEITEARTWSLIGEVRA